MNDKIPSDVYKVLFLDIDGVINSYRTSLAYGGFPFNFESDTHKFDIVAIKLLQKLCEETQCSVVLASTWRMHFTVEECAKALSLPIISSTPYTYRGHRGDEVALWLENYPQVTKYAIVDDENNFYPKQQEYFIQTNIFNGLSYDNYSKLLIVLQGG